MEPTTEPTTELTIQEKVTLTLDSFYLKQIIEKLNETKLILEKCLSIETKNTILYKIFWLRTTNIFLEDVENTLKEVDNKLYK